jgi:N-succinyldiaminopimelate aminotransferase
MTWVTAPPPLLSAVRTAKQFLTYVSSGPFQYATAKALELPDSYYTDLRDSHRRKRDLLATGLTEAGFHVYQPAGTYFITTDVSGLGESDGHAFCRALPQRCGVVAIPNVVFYDNTEAGRSQVRFAFCKNDEILIQAAARLKTLHRTA